MLALPAGIRPGERIAVGVAEPHGVVQSVQTTKWRDGRTNALPMVETAILMRQDGQWRIMYKHISWGDVAGNDRGEP